MIIQVVYAGRKLTVKVPRGTEEVSFEEPPPVVGGRNGQDKEKPLIILTDRT
jgi:hypothetical protein